MTTPGTPDLSFLIPKKYKTLVGLIGTGLSFLVPLVLQYTDALPSPWPAVIGFVLWVLTVLGIYRAPYVPTGAVIAPNTPAVATATAQAAAPVVNPATGGAYRNPWQ